MAADSKELGGLHEQLTAVYLQLIKPRLQPVIVKGETVLDREGNVLLVEVMPSAAELAAAGAFLKQNNITAIPGESDDLKQLQQQLAERRRNRAPVLPDFDAEGLH
jgi:hypothetical protein